MVVNNLDTNRYADGSWATHMSLAMQVSGLQTFEEDGVFVDKRG